MRVVLIGLGDLGKRIAVQLLAVGGVSELVVVGSSAQQSRAFAALAGTLSASKVRAVDVRVLDSDSMLHWLQREPADLIVQAAALVSPWALHGRTDSVAECASRAGFAFFLAAQLPLISALMQTVVAAGKRTPVVNCSYPDVTHCVLGRLGLAPTVGIGNVGMIAEALRVHSMQGAAAKPAPGSTDAFLRVLAHHAHVQPALAGSNFPTDSATRLPAPHVYRGEQRLTWGSDIAIAPGLPLDRDLNALSAAHAVYLIRALLGLSAPLATHAPGPAGLPGGYPVLVAENKVTLNLPKSVALEDAIALQHRFAQADGIAEISADGVVHFTEAFRDAVRPLSQELAAPLHLGEALQRFGVLQRILARASAAVSGRLQLGGNA